MMPRDRYEQAVARMRELVVDGAAVVEEISRDHYRPRRTTRLVFRCARDQHSQVMERVMDLCGELQTCMTMCFIGQEVRASFHVETDLTGAEYESLGPRETRVIYRSAEVVW